MGSQTVAGLSLIVDTSRALRSITGLTRKFNVMGNSMTSTLRKTNVLQRSLVTGFTGIAAAMAPIRMFKTFVDYEKSLRKLNIVAGFTENVLESTSLQIQKLAIQLGKKPKELVDGLEDIVQAGFHGADAMKVLTAATKLAVGGNTTLRKASDALTTILNAYGKTADEASEISDVLFTVQKHGKVTIAELSREFGRLVGISKSANIPFKTLGALMAALTQKGLRARLATTSMNAMFFRFAQNAKKIKGAFTEVGGAGRALVEKGLLYVLKRTKDLTDGSLPKLAEKMGFFRRDLTGMAILLGGGKLKKGMRFEDLKEGTKEMEAFKKGSLGFATFFKNIDRMKNASGATQKAVIQMMKATGSQISRLLAAFDVLSISITEVFQKDINKAISSILIMLLDMIDWVKANKKIVKTIAGVFGALI